MTRRTSIADAAWQEALRRENTDAFSHSAQSRAPEGTAEGSPMTRVIA